MSILNVFAAVGAATRRQLAAMGYAARLFGRLL